MRTIESKKKWRIISQKELGQIKGRGWGSGEKDPFKNCPPPYEPGGKKDDKET